MIKELIERHQKVGSIMKAKHPEILEKILRSSPLDPLGKNYIHESIFLAANSLSTRPLCSVCNTQSCRFRNIKTGYVLTCQQCKGKSSWRKDKFRNACLSKFGSTTPAGNAEVISRIIKTKVDKGIYKTQEERTEYQNYMMTVHGLTAKQPLHLLDNFDKRGRSGKEDAWQVDHKFSIRDGFRNKLPPETIAHFLNLEMLPAGANRKKWHNSSISLEHLLQITRM